MTQPSRPSISDYWVGPAVWLESPTEYAVGSMAFVGPVLFPAGIDPGTTQTAVMVLGPGGARIGVPPVFDGESGPSPTLRNINYTPVPYGEALPSPAASWTKVIPGGPGVPDVYDMNLAVQQGAPGVSGDFAIADATDLSGTLADKDGIRWNASTSKFNPFVLPVSNWYNATNIATTPSGAGQVRSVTSITVPPQPNPWIPVVAASVEVFPTNTASATCQVDVVARMGGAANSQGGVEVGRGFGVLSTAPPAPSIIPTFGGGLLTSGFAQVASGDSATIWLNCEEQQSTTDTYATGRAGFLVGAVPVGLT